MVSTDDNSELQRGPIRHPTVDRILRQQHAQQQASEAAKKSEQKALSSSLSPSPVDSQNIPPSQITKPSTPAPSNPTKNPLMRLIGKPDLSPSPEPPTPPRVPLKQASESKSNTGTGVTPLKDISEKTIGIVCGS